MACNWKAAYKYGYLSLFDASQGPLKRIASARFPRLSSPMSSLALPNRYVAFEEGGILAVHDTATLGTVFSVAVSAFTADTQPVRLLAIHPDTPNVVVFHCGASVKVVDLLLQQVLLSVPDLPSFTVRHLHLTGGFLIVIHSAANLRPSLIQRTRTCIYSKNHESGEWSSECPFVHEEKDADVTFGPTPVLALPLRDADQSLFVLLHMRYHIQQMKHIQRTHLEGFIYNPKLKEVTSKFKHLFTQSTPAMQIDRNYRITMQFMEVLPISSKWTTVIQEKTILVNPLSGEITPEPMNSWEPPQFYSRKSDTEVSKEVGNVFLSRVSTDEIKRLQYFEICESRRARLTGQLTWRRLQIPNNMSIYAIKYVSPGKLWVYTIYDDYEEDFASLAVDGRVELWSAIDTPNSTHIKSSM